MRLLLSLHLFFFTHPATTEIYTLSLHDALPIYVRISSSTMYNRFLSVAASNSAVSRDRTSSAASRNRQDRKSTRLNSSHITISYAVFCLKKKKQKNNTRQHTTYLNPATYTLPTA